MLAHTHTTHTTGAAYYWCILTVGWRAVAVTWIGFPLGPLWDWTVFQSPSLSLSLLKDHIGSISCCLADFWAAASPTLAVSCLITCSMCLSVRARLLCSWISVYKWSLHSISGPSEVHAHVFVCERSISCSRCGSPLHVDLLHARCWLSARPPHLSSVESPHFLSLPAHRKASLKSGWLSKELFIAAHCRSLRHGWFSTSQFETEVLRTIAIDFSFCMQDCPPDWNSFIL